MGQQLKGNYFKWASKTKPIMVFVYGTLRLGRHNNERFLRKACYLGPARTTFGAYLTGGTVPYLHPTDEKGKKVYGEIFMVDQTELDRLDRLEGHPHAYKRKAGKFQFAGTGEYVSAFYYEYQNNDHGPARKFQDYNDILDAMG